MSKSDLEKKQQLRLREDVTQREKETGKFLIVSDIIIILTVPSTGNQSQVRKISSGNSHNVFAPLVDSPTQAPFPSPQGLESIMSRQVCIPPFNTHIYKSHHSKLVQSRKLHQAELTLSYDPHPSLKLQHLSHCNHSCFLHASLSPPITKCAQALFKDRNILRSSASSIVSGSQCTVNTQRKEVQVAYYYGSKLELYSLNICPQGHIQKTVGHQVYLYHIFFGRKVSNL